MEGENEDLHPPPRDSKSTLVVSREKEDRRALISIGYKAKKKRVGRHRLSVGGLRENRA